MLLRGATYHYEIHIHSKDDKFNTVSKLYYHSYFKPLDSLHIWLFEAVFYSGIREVNIHKGKKSKSLETGNYHKSTAL